MKRKLFLSASVFTMLVFSSFASDAYETGYSLFSTNKPEEAIPYLETALNDLATPPEVYIYLGIAYYQTGQYVESLDVFRKGLSASGTNKRIIAFNAGNSAYAMRDYATAEEMFSLASVADPAFASPVLNRANARLSQDKLQGALEDYQRYLVLVPPPLAYFAFIKYPNVLHGSFLSPGPSIGSQMHSTLRPLCCCCC